MDKFRERRWMKKMGEAEVKKGGSRDGSLFYRPLSELYQGINHIRQVEVLSWPLLQETIFPTSPCFITMWVPASTFYPTPTDCLSGHFLLHKPPQTWPRCAISLTCRETSYKINVTRRCPLDEHVLSSQVLEFTTLFALFVEVYSRNCYIYGE